MLMSFLSKMLRKNAIDDDEKNDSDQDGEVGNKKSEKNDSKFNEDDYNAEIYEDDVDSIVRKMKRVMRLIQRMI